MVDNIRMPTGVGPITSPRPVKSVRRQDKDKKEKHGQRFEDQLNQNEDDNPQAAADDDKQVERSAQRGPAFKKTGSKSTPKDHKSDGEAGHIIDIHA